MNSECSGAIKFINKKAGIKMNFEYVSSKEAATKTGVTERWIQQLCKEGKVEGAVQFGDRGIWLIPQKWVEEKAEARRDHEK